MSTSPESVVDFSMSALPSRVWVTPPTVSSRSISLASIRMNGPAGTTTLMVSLPTTMEVSTAVPVVFNINRNVPLARVRTSPGVLRVTSAVAWPTTPAVVIKKAPLASEIVSVALPSLVAICPRALLRPTATVVAPSASAARSKVKSPTRANPPRFRLAPVTARRRNGPASVVSISSEIASIVCVAPVPRLSCTPSVSGWPAPSTAAVPTRPSSLSTNMPSAPVIATTSVLPSPNASETLANETVTCLVPAVVTSKPKSPVSRWPRAWSTTLVAWKERSPTSASTNTESVLPSLAVNVIDWLTSAGVLLKSTVAEPEIVTPATPTTSIEPAALTAKSPAAVLITPMRALRSTTPTALGFSAAELGSRRSGPRPRNISALLAPKTSSPLIVSNVTSPSIVMKSPICR